MEVHDEKRPPELLYKEGSDIRYETAQQHLGPMTSYILMTDAKHLCFVLARYKFSAAMVKGKATVLEIGTGEGFGLPILAQAVSHVYAVEKQAKVLQAAARRLKHLKNVTYLNLDITESRPNILVDAAVAVDVIEHIDPADEPSFMLNIVRCLKSDGVAIIGTPNIRASQYAGAGSKVQHINLKSMASLRQLMAHYFSNVFMFGMNDEVVHTGHEAMCHYIFSIGVSPCRSLPGQ